MDPRYSELDRIDTQLLELLAKNCRLTHAAIGRALRLSTDGVGYRIRRLWERGLLSSKVLFVDARRLGFTRYHLLIRIALDPDARDKIVKKIAAHPAVMWVNTFIGRFDLQVIVDARTGLELNAIREELFDGIQSKVRDYTTLTHLCDLEFTQLNPLLDRGTKIKREADQSFSDLLFERNFPVEPDFELVSLGRYDGRILQLLADEPQRSITELAEMLQIDRQTVRKRIVSMIRSKVILNFSAIPNLAALGFVTYYFLVRLNQGVKREVLQRPFRQLNNIFYAGQMSGDYDLILYLNARSPQELDASIALFRRELQSEILSLELLVQERVFHWRQFTPMLYRASVQ